MLTLRFEETGVTKTLRLKDGTTKVGRLQTSDWVLNDPSVSRHHATLIVDGTRLQVQDAGSRYGTFVNGERVIAVQDPVEVKDGDTLMFGEFSAHVEQSLLESDLLSENHQVAEGPGTILKPVEESATKTSPADAPLMKLLGEVGRALVSTQTLPDILNRVVDMAFASVPADRAFLMLRESSDAGLEARVIRQRDGQVPSNVTLSRAVVRKVMHERVAMLAQDATTDPGLSVTDSILRFNIRSFMCAPLWSRDDVIGVLYVDSPRRAQFNAPDLDTLVALANASAIAIEQARLSAQLVEEQRRRERLARYHSPAVVNRIIHGTGTLDDAPSAQERDVTIMFCDLVGFTTMCEGLTPVEAAAVLNGFLSRMTDIVFEHEGTLDKFLGDALLAVWGAPFEDPDHALKAVTAAITMRQALGPLNAQLAQHLQMRIAINTGVALTGDIGSPRRREFTVLGDVVNTASRIEGEVAKPGEIVVSEETYNRVKSTIKGRALAGITLRGRSMPSKLWAIEGYVSEQ